MWTKLGNNLIKNGNVYSTENFQPTQKDIGKILDIGGRAVARDKSRIMIFNEDGSFKESGPYFTTTQVDFANENDLIVIDAIKTLEQPFGIKEVHDITGIPMPKLRNHFYQRLRKNHWVVKDGEGYNKWRLNV